MTKQERFILAHLQVANVMEDAAHVLDGGRDVLQTAYGMTSCTEGMRTSLKESGMTERYEDISYRVFTAINDLLSLAEDIRKMQKG